MERHHGGNRRAATPNPESRSSNLFLRRLWYDYLRLWAVLLGALFFDIRSVGARHVPRRGGVLIASTHQSFLDPVLIGLGLPRQINYLARESLFRHWRPFAWLMQSLNAIPLRLGASDMRAFRESVKRLQAGEVLLLFPEGTRTRDGRIGRLLPGVWNIAHRARVPIVPAVIDGAYQAWPRTHLLPRPHPIRVMYGPPISLAEIDAAGSDGLTALLSDRLRKIGSDPIFQPNTHGGP
jgi:1-acyl-sn-glycerol-3-phosphate acyltransferase